MLSAAMDPLRQFTVKTWIPLNLWGLDLSLTNSAFFMVLAALLPMLFFKVALRKESMVPSLLQLAAEAPFEFVSSMLQEANGDKGKPFFPVMFTLFIFLLMGNMLGMIPGAFTFTSQIVVTFGIALLVFFFITIVGLIRHGWRFLGIFLPHGVPWIMAPLFIPIEIISYLSRPLSLSVRLFANVMAGHAMMKIFAYFTLSIGVLGIAPFLINVALTGFEFLVAFLQAYVFTVLCCIYLHDALYVHD
jgi:F-type H+-transporting ATPase subunit a